MVSDRLSHHGLSLAAEKTESVIISIRSVDGIKYLGVYYRGASVVQGTFFEHRPEDIKYSVEFSQSFSITIGGIYFQRS